MPVTPRLSFEFFPPQTLDAAFRLWETVQVLAPLRPDFVSVTYGAGGTTRRLTHEAVGAIGRNYGLNVAAHLTCVDSTRTETLEIAAAYAEAGVTEIVALRGDAPKGNARFTPHPDGFASSVDLVAALAATGKFNIRVGAYPERHPDAADSRADVLWLKRKIDAGATSALRGAGNHRPNHPRHPAHHQLGPCQTLCRPLRRADTAAPERRFRDRAARWPRRVAGADTVHGAVFAADRRRRGASAFLHAEPAAPDAGCLPCAGRNSPGRTGEGGLTQTLVHPEGSSIVGTAKIKGCAACRNRSTS